MAKQRHPSVRLPDLATSLGLVDALNVSGMARWLDSGAFADVQRLIAPQAAAIQETQRKIREALGASSTHTAGIAELLARLVPPQQTAWAQTVDSLRRTGLGIDQIGAQFSQQFEASTEALRRSLGIFTPELLARLPSTERRFAKLLLRRRWVGIDRYIETAEMPRMLALGRRGPAILDAEVCRRFRADRYALLNRMVRSWWDVRYLEKRRKEIRQAVKAHRLGLYAVSIPTLFPLVDGLTAELLPTKRGSVKAKQAVQAHHEEHGTIWSETLVDLITATFYLEYDFGSAKRAPSRINRHAVMHGRVADYGTEANSLRALLLVDTFAHIARARLTSMSPRGRKN